MSSENQASLMESPNAEGAISRSAIKPTIAEHPLRMRSFNPEISLQFGKKDPDMEVSSRSVVMNTTLEKKIMNNGGHKLRPDLRCHNEVSISSPEEEEKSDASFSPPSFSERDGEQKEGADRFIEMFEEESGTWGTITERDIIFVVFVFLFTFIVAAVVFSMVFLKRDDEHSHASVLASTPTEKYQIILEALHGHPTTVEYLGILPQYASQLNCKHNPHAHAVVQAVSWLVCEDSVNEIDTLVTRFALATIFYALHGEKWNNNENWLLDQPACSWYGISCGETLGSHVIQDVDLSENNLSNNISAPCWSLLQETHSLWLNGNELTGNIPGEALGGMSSLVYLHLENNRLSGTIPPTLKNHSLLGTLYVHGNDLTGMWPDAFCPTYDAGCDCMVDGPFYEFGLDCKKIFCQCCTPYNCFDP